MKILVISMAGIGDALIATPLIHELRANFPDATIDALVHVARLEGFAGKQSASEPRSPEKPHQGAASWRRWNFLWSLRKNRYDVSINTHPQSRMHYRVAARIVGAPLRISHEYECFGWLDRRLVNRTLPQDYTRHSIENNFDVLPLLGAKENLPSHEMEIFLTPDEEKWADDFLAEAQIGRTAKSSAFTSVPAAQKICR